MSGWGAAAEMLLALQHWADLTGGVVTLRGFSESVPDFQCEVVDRIEQWHPDGIILRMRDLNRMALLRRNVPHVPLLSTFMVPPALADICVVADIAEAITLARDHFHQQGLRVLALYCSCAKDAVPHRMDAFRKAVPGGLTFVYPHEEQQKGLARTVAVGRRRLEMTYPHEKGSTGEQKVRAWMKKLPKPVGIIATEVGAAGFLLHQCRGVGLRIPQDVQIVGIDPTDVCLACEPHLTGIHLPFARIGEQAMETMLHRLRCEQPPPPRIIPVPGCTLTVRDTTSPVRIGAATIHKALEIMEARGLKHMPVARIAKLAGIGRTTLYKDVAASTGHTPGRRLKQLRLQKAIEMLGETTASLEVVAEACGFSTPFSFSRFFKRETGEAPSVYRMRTAQPQGLGSRV